MSEALALQRPAVTLPWRLLRLLPGVALLSSIGYAGKLAETLVKDYGKAHHLALPNIEYVLWAILIGLVIANTVGWRKIFRPGVATYDFWLKAGIVLLGARFLLGDVLKLGSVSLGLVVIELGVAIAIMTVLGRWFKLKPKLTSLLAVGSSICGVSAIIAAKGAIEADDDDATFAIAAILALGAFGLFAYPAIGHFLHMSDHASGSGPGSRSTTQPKLPPPAPSTRTAAARWPCSPKPPQRYDRLRVLGVCRALGLARPGEDGGRKAAFLWQKFPKFVLGFLFISLLATFHAFDKSADCLARELSRWAFLLTFAGVA